MKFKPSSSNLSPLTHLTVVVVLSRCHPPVDEQCVGQLSTFPYAIAAYTMYKTHEWRLVGEKNYAVEENQPTTSFLYMRCLLFSTFLCSK